MLFGAVVVEVEVVVVVFRSSSSPQRRKSFSRREARDVGLVWRLDECKKREGGRC